MLSILLIAPKVSAQDPPATPAGFVVSDMIGPNPVADGQLFLAAGPNDVGSADIQYRLFYALSSDAPSNPLDATEYEFGTTAGDGAGVNAFGFVVSGLEPGQEYTFWLYQYNSAASLFSTPAVASAVSGGDAGDPGDPGDTAPPATPAGFVVTDMIGPNPVADGQLFLAAGPNDVASSDIRYRLFYALSSDAPSNPLDATEYEFGTTAGDGAGVNAFGFVVSGLEPGQEYTFWLYQYNSAESLFSAPAVGSAVAGGNAGDPTDPGPIANPDEVEDLQKFPLAYNMDTDVIDWNDYTYYSFDGAALQRIENPDKSEGNQSDYVLEYVKEPSGQPWGGFFYHLQETINTTEDAVFRLNVWSPRDGIRGLMKLESRAGATTGDLFADITVSGEWTTLEWDLSGVNREVDWDVVTIIMDLDTENPPQGGARDTWYLDDFELAGVVVVSDPVDPDGPIVISNPDEVDDLQKFPLVYNLDTEAVDWDDYTYYSFEGAVLRRVENPDQSAGNESDYVLEYVKNPAGQPWGGFFYHLQDTINTTEDAVFRLNVWSPRDGIRGLMKLESRAGATTGDLFADITVSGEWTTLEWDLSGVNHEVDWDLVTIIMDLDTENPPQGGARDTWYLDDFELAGVVVVSDPVDPVDPIVIENPEERADLQEFPVVFNIDNVDVDWTDYTFYAFDGAALRRIENPDQSAGNPTEYVLEYTKNDGGEAWAGFLYHLENPVYSTSETVFRLNVWSPRDGVQALMKLETRDDQNSTGDQLLPVTLAEEWNTLEWNLGGTNQNIPWDRVVVIMDLDTANPPQGGARDTWYLDDFELMGVVLTSSERTELPTAHQLHQNYPNPFNPTTQIHFELPQTSEVTLDVFNVWGQRVAVLATGTYQAGTHAVAFDATDLPSGTYFYRIQAGAFTQTQKMTLVK